MIHALAILTIILAVALPLICRGSRRCAIAIPLSPRERVIHTIVLVTLALMAVSSILVLAFGGRMRGWMLMLHMTVAPLFALAIAVLAVLWQDRSSCLLRLVLLSALATILTAMLMMMPWFASDTQRCLLTVHRISSMVLLVAASAQSGRIWFACGSSNAGAADAARAGD
jgi:hypothetical protein